jgi:hypothetical protein
MKSILIEDVEYAVIISDADDIWGVLDILKPMQAHRYYDRYVYKTLGKETRACYADDVANNWAM